MPNQVDIASLYLNVLGRNADAGGLIHYAGQGMTLDQIKQSLMNSEEYKQKINPPTPAPVNVYSPSNSPGGSRLISGPAFDAVNQSTSAPTAAPTAAPVTYIYSPTNSPGGSQLIGTVAPSAAPTPVTSASPTQTPAQQGLINQATSAPTPAPTAAVSAAPTSPSVAQPASSKIDTSLIQNFKLKQQLMQQAQDSLNATYDDPFATNEARAQGQALLDQANAIDVDENAVRNQLRQAIANGEDLRSLYGSGYQDAINLVNDLGIVAEKDDVRILPASPTGYQGAWKFDPVYGSEYYRDYLTNLGSQLGINQDLINKTAGDAALNNWYSGAGRETYADNPAYLSQLTYNVLTNAGIDPNSGQGQTIVENAKQVGSQLTNALYSESDSSGIIKQYAKFATSNPLGIIAISALSGGLGGPALASALGATSAAATTAAAGAAAGAGVGAVKGIGEGNVGAIIENAAKGGVQGAIAGGASSTLNGLISPVLTDAGITNPTLNGAITKGISTATVSGANAAINGTDVSDAILKGAFTGVITGALSGSGPNYRSGLPGQEGGEGLDSTSGDLTGDQMFDLYTDGVDLQELTIVDDGGQIQSESGINNEVAQSFPVSTPTTGQPTELEPNIFDQDNVGVPTSATPGDGAPDRIIIPSPGDEFGPPVDLINQSPGLINTPNSGVNTNAGGGSSAGGTPTVKGPNLGVTDLIKVVDGVVNGGNNSSGGGSTQRPTTTSPVTANPVKTVDATLAAVFNPTKASFAKRGNSTSSGKAVRFNVDRALGEGAKDKYITNGLISRYIA